MEFAEITEDPFTNTTNNFYLVLDIFSHPTPNPNSTGINVQKAGALTDPNNRTVGFFYIASSQDYVVAGSLSDEAFAHSYVVKRDWMVVPPQFNLSGHQFAIGFWLSPKEVEQFILGRLSLKGGD